MSLLDIFDTILDLHQRKPPESFIPEPYECIKSKKCERTARNFIKATCPVLRVIAAIEADDVETAKKNLSKGDHIACNRTVYSHHGIYDGYGWVYEYNEGVIRHVSLSSFANGDDIFSLDSPCIFSPEEIIRRALSRIGEREYNLFDNNCENFARWCRNGEGDLL